MKKRRTSTTVSMINYHFVFCPRYRRKIFLIEGVDTRLKELISEVCEKNEMNVIAMECHVDHVHLFLNAGPNKSPSEIMKVIKGGTSHQIRREFEKLSRMPNLWTRSFFVSTAGEVSSETIKNYVENQKSR